MAEQPYGANGQEGGGVQTTRSSSTYALGVEPARLERAARSECTILITGETGVGKGHLAMWLHRKSRRSNTVFVPVNCGAIPESLIDSQLFGHVRGAFSGATADHIGFVRAAERGTLFLDEVAELPPTAQTRLLRLLQEGEIQPVGHPKPIVVNVRVMAASNADLDAAVESRKLREDLLYRLDVIRVHLPPLRERRDELEGLLAQFNREFSEVYDQAELRFSRGALDRLLSFDWPGNIRQLRTVVERMHVLCPTDRVTADDVLEVGRLDPGGPARPLDQVRLDEVRRVLADSGGSVARTAAAFGVHRSTIYRWLNRPTA